MREYSTRDRTSMGTKYDSLTFRGPTQEEVAKAVAAQSSHAFISPTVSGLTVAYPARLSSDMDYRKVSRRLSKKLGCPILTAGVFDDDIFYYALYDGGELVDEYNSRPDYFDGSSIGLLDVVGILFTRFILRREPRPRYIEPRKRALPSGGQPDTMCRILGMPGNSADVEQVLRFTGGFPVEGNDSELGRHAALMKALGWPDVAPPDSEELSDFYSIYQADYDVLCSNMFSHVTEGWREIGTSR